MSTLKQDPEFNENSELYEHHRIVADKGQQPLRIDKFLVNRLEHISRSKIQSAAQAGNILVDERKGYAIVPTSMYWKKNKIKVEIALVKGKKSHDKRAAAREKDWKKEKERILKLSKKY